MAWFCDHQWVVIEKTYAGPSAHMLEYFQAADACEAQRVLQGSTDVLLQCRKCHRVKLVTMTGKSVEVIR